MQTILKKKKQYLKNVEADIAQKNSLIIQCKSTQTLENLYLNFNQKPGKWFKRQKNKN